MSEKTQGKYPSQFDKVKEITDRLEAGVLELMNSESYKTFLKTMAHFHAYSLNNTILIALQRPDSTYVAGYAAWKKNFGRQVLKGEQGIRILAPTPYKKKMEVAVIDPATERIVLTKYAGRPQVHYALVAGFTEIGESIEQTVAREVMEEVGLKVKNLVFYKSQPWSYSDTLLVGFYYEVDGSTEITVDHSELKVAEWFTREEALPRENDRVSLTAEMIRRFKERGNAVLNQ